MAKPGPPPKPTALKLIAGNPGEHKLPENEPKPEIAAPTAPRWLNAEARAEWDRLVPDLLRLKLLSELDRGLLAGMCQWWSKYVRAERQLAREPILRKNRNHVLTTNVNLAIAREAWAHYARAAAEFGLTPAARSRISVPTTPRESKRGESSTPFQF
jgi:P27 family predicted phage terminase small subunit